MGLTTAQVYRKNAENLIWEAKQETSNSGAWSKYHSAEIWLNRLDGEFEEEFTEKDYEDRLYCQRMMIQLL